MSRAGFERIATTSRRDGWPLCPVCGEDELGDLGHLEADPTARLFCYRCTFRGYVRVTGVDPALLPAEDSR